MNFLIIDPMDILKNQKLANTNCYHNQNQLGSKIYTLVYISFILPSIDPLTSTKVPNSYVAMILVVSIFSMNTSLADMIVIG